MSPVIKRKLYFLLNLRELTYEDLDRLDEIEKKSLQEEECSEDELEYISRTFIRYMPRDPRILDEIMG